MVHRVVQQRGHVPGTKRPSSARLADHTQEFRQSAQTRRPGWAHPQIPGGPARSGSGLGPRSPKGGSDMTWRPSRAGQCRGLALIFY